MNAIVDSGFIVAFGNRNDQHHTWAVEIAKSITEPLLTCEAVFAEAAFHLKSSAYVFALLESGMMRIAFSLSQHASYLQALARKYADRNPDLADLCIIRMSEIYPRHTVITVDEKDFRVYRRNGRSVIPILSPPRRR
ncbi:MAG: type II toxin-antitoxin system VapC family toxin [Terriglobia bacterium]